jgi:hypothetical protein
MKQYEFDDEIKNVLLNKEGKCSKGNVCLATLCYKRLIHNTENGHNYLFQYYPDKVENDLCEAVAKLYNIDSTEITAFGHGVYLRGIDNAFTNSRFSIRDRKRTLDEIREETYNDINKTWRNFN